VYFNGKNAKKKVDTPKNTTLMAFFKLNCIDEFARTLLYSEIPSYYRYVNGQFKRRKKGVRLAGKLRLLRFLILLQCFTSENEFVL